MILLNADIAGWAALTFSFFVSLSNLPQVFAARQRGSLRGENVDPWITGILNTISFTIYAFNPANGCRAPLKIW